MCVLKYSMIFFYVSLCSYIVLYNIYILIYYSFLVPTLYSIYDCFFSTILINTNCINIIHSNAKHFTVIKIKEDRSLYVRSKYLNEY